MVFLKVRHCRVSQPPGYPRGLGDRPLRDLKIEPKTLLAAVLAFSFGVLGIVLLLAILTEGTKDDKLVFSCL